MLRCFQVHRKTSSKRFGSLTNPFDYAQGRLFRRLVLSVAEASRRVLDGKDVKALRNKSSDRDPVL